MPVSRRGWSSDIALSRLCQYFMMAWLLILLWPPSSVHADPTDLDQDFGSLGLTVTNASGIDLTPISLIPLPDGGYVIVGTGQERSIESSPPFLAAAVYDGNGNIDTGYGLPGLGNILLEQASNWVNDIPGAQVEAVRINADSSAYHLREGIPGIVVGVHVTINDDSGICPCTFNFIVRISLSKTEVSLGILDPDFGTSGYVRRPEQSLISGTTDRTIQGIAVDSAQRIVALVAADVAGAGDNRDVLRLTAQGVLDASWGGAGITNLELPLDAPGWRLMVGAGDAVHVIASRRDTPFLDLAFSRLTSSGVLDTTYGAVDGHTFVRNTVLSGQQALGDAVFDPEGRLLFTGIGFMARLLANGQFDSDFSGDHDGVEDGFFSSVSPPFACAIAVQPDGRIITTRDGGGFLLIYRYVADALGEDDTFIDFLGSNIVDPFGELNIENRTFNCIDVHLQDDGKIVVAGRQGFNGVDPGEIGNPLTGFALIRLEGGDLIPSEPVNVVRFVQDSYQASEGAGTVTLMVELLRGADEDSVVTVDYQTLGETATGGAPGSNADYVTTNGTLTFEAGETSQSIVVTIIDDTIFEGNVAEVFRVELSNVTGGAVLGIPETAYVQISDNDVGADLAVTVELDSSGEDDQGRLVLEFLVTVTHEDGPEPATGTQVSIARSGVVFEQINSDPAVGTFNSLTGQWAVGTLAQGASATLRLTYRQQVAGSTGNLQVTAFVTADPDDMVPGNNNAETTIPITTGTDLGLAGDRETIFLRIDAKSSQDPNRGGATIFVTNLGPRDASSVMLGLSCAIDLDLGCGMRVRGISAPLQSEITIDSIPAGESVTVDLTMWVAGTLENGRTITPISIFLVSSEPADSDNTNNLVTFSVTTTDPNNRGDGGILPIDPLMLALMLPLMIVLLIARRQNSNRSPPR